MSQLITSPLLVSARPDNEIMKNSEDMKSSNVLPPHKVANDNIEYKDNIKGNECPTGYVLVNGKCVKKDN